MGTIGLLDIAVTTILTCVILLKSEDLIYTPAAK
jgi:hypothetical protein